MRQKTIGLLSLFFILSTQAWGSNQLTVIGPDHLKEMLPSVTIVDARDTGFTEGHIPNSIPMNWSDWTVEKVGSVNLILGNSANWGKVLSDATVAPRLQKLGFSKNKPIVVVGEPGKWGEEGRVAWNFLFWGAKKVSLLEGGYPSWASRGFPVETGAAKKQRTGDFKTHFNLSRRATLEEVKANLSTKKRALYDARTQEEFEGKTVMGQARGGRIPGAILVPENDLYEKNGKYLSQEALKKLLGSTSKNSSITYCTGGVRSALLALLIEARLGIVTSSYDGSIWEWSSHEDLPMGR